MRPILILAGLLVALAAGCGDDDGTAQLGAKPPVDDVVLALDFTPNPVHAPVYAAVDGGHDRNSGIRLAIRTPGAGPDSLKLLAAGKVDVALLDIHDLAIARAGGADVVAVGALVTRPLAALIARASIRRPRDLEGETVGVSGLPSDPAFLAAVVADDGGDPRRVKQATIGFNAVASLVSGKVAAVPAFWNAEGVVLKRRGFESREFRFEDYGAPPYPEIVLVTRRTGLDERRETVAAVLSAIRAGVADVRADPASSVERIAKAAGTRDAGLVEAQLEAVVPLFSDDLALERDVLERWADFDARIGIVEARPDVGRAFDFGFGTNSG